MQRHGYEASVAASGGAVLEMYHDYDLILLDADLPDLDGVSVCEIIRRTSDIPIIGFTAEAAEVDRVLLLESGCDDCVQRPYRARELVARIKAILRRTGTLRRAGARDGGADPDRLEFGTLVIVPSRREVELENVPLALTRKEFDLLHILAAEPDRIFGRQELMCEVWDYPEDNRITAQASRTIDTHVSSLRSKLGNSDWITTIRGVGFRFGVSAPEPAEAGSGADGARAAGGSAGGGPVPLRPRLVRLRSG
ncbi:response regulator transcription factor [Streptomyces sp. PLAI1-29]|uniref:Response regulator transcription factor n=2 Tax=Streptomyces zingiberis TaxID=2053010 RepID=A0ABX1C7G6_9ACTN|nr:response regulator transcription factor [Streptomyces zingiberis]